MPTTPDPIQAAAGRPALPAGRCGGCGRRHRVSPTSGYCPCCAFGIRRQAARHVTAQPGQLAGEVVDMIPRTPRPPSIGHVLDRARAELAARPPGQRALVDQNTEVLRTRLARAGVPLTPAAVAVFAAGVAELGFQAARTFGIRGAAASLLHAAAQLAAPAACPGCVAALDRTLTDAAAGPDAPPGPQGGGVR